MVVTSWGLRLCGLTPRTCRPGASVELDLRLSKGLWAGIITRIVTMAIGVVASLLTARSHPALGLLLAPAILALAITTCILLFHVVLPSFSVYICRLVPKAGAALR